jgi:hypothetical protein
MSSSRYPIVAGAAIALLVSLVFGASINPGFWHGDLFDPDSAMRLVRLSAIVHAGLPLDAVARDGSGDGTVLHWSHLLDSILLFLAAPEAAFVGWHRGLVLAAMALGPLCMAALGGALAWASAPFADRQWRWVPAIAASLAAPVAGYGVPGVVHHHVLLAVTAVMSAGWAVRIVRGEAGGIALGAWSAVAAWLSPEAMPLSLMAMCLVWVAWIERPRAGLARSLAETGLAFFVVVLAAWIVDPPGASRWAAEQDRLSIIYVTLAAAAACCGIAAWSGLPRAAVAALGGVLALAWLGAFPVLLRGTYGLLPPDVAHVFLDDIAEMQPIVHLGPAVSLLLPGLATTALLAWFGVRRRSLVLLYAAACGALLVLGGEQHVRFAAYPAVFAAALAPAALTALGPTVWRTAALAATLLVPLSNSLIPSAGANEPTGKSCGLQGMHALLAPYAGQVVLSDAGDTPELLWRSDVLTVGSLFHRNPTGFMRLIDAWRSAPGQTEPTAVLASRARLVLVCPTAHLPRLFAVAPQPTLAATLRAGVVPPWLHEVGTNTGGFVLYRIGNPRS